MKPTPSIKDMVAELIATPSVSSVQPDFDQSNETVIHLLANWLDPLGFRIDIQPVQGRPGKFNMTATIGQGSGGLVLSGHSDTVPFDEHLWQSDPFKVTEVDDKWYGLGSCDMKSFFAVAIQASLQHLDENLQKPLTIMATADEESTMAGAKQLTRENIDNAELAIIGEPTGLVPITKHKGISMMRLRIEGSSGHSSNPALGNNAIEGMHLALSELMQYRQELESAFKDDNFAVTTPTMNFGCIHGGDNPNRICDHAELAFDFREVPSMDMTDFVGNLEQRLKQLIEPQGFGCNLEMLHSAAPAFDNSDSLLAQEIEELTGQAPDSVAFGTEAPFLKKLGVDTVVIGPGSIDQAHQPNEFLPLNQLNPAIDLIDQLITKHCH